MSEPLVKQYCTELYQTDAEDGFGKVGNFSVYEAADVEAILRQREEGKRFADALMLEGVQKIEELRAQLAAMTAERDEWQVKARWKHTHDDSLECELQQQLATSEHSAYVRAWKIDALKDHLAAAQARCAQLEEALSMWTQHYAGRLYGDADLPEIFAKSIVALTPTERTLA